MGGAASRPEATVIRGRWDFQVSWNCPPFEDPEPSNDAFSFVPVAEEGRD